MSSSGASTSRSLLRTEAEQRAALLAVHSYDLALDLAGGDDPGTATFGSRTVVRFASAGGSTFLDLKPAELLSATLDGAPLDPASLREGRLPLETSAGDHEVVVEARMPYRNDGEGLHRSVDPADGRAYLYGMSFMDAAPTVLACFDQPDLKAPYRLRVRAPREWVVVGNGRATRTGDDGDVALWELAETQPLSTYFVTLVAGPYHLVSDQHDGIALGLSSRASLAGALEAEAEELFTLTRQSFDELHRLFGIRYAFGDYHQAFVPDFNAGAMENPGCVTFRDQMLFPDRVTRAARVNRASTVAHEMAHQWFGNLVTPRWWDDLWLNESFAEYLGWRVIADATVYDDAWAQRSQARRQWGLHADQRPSTHPVAGNGATDAVAALQDFDGISYAKGSTVLKQLASRIGDEAFLGGVVDHLTRHRFGNATMADLVASWEGAGAGDLSGFTGSWLRTAGLDTLRVERPSNGSGGTSVRRLGPRECGDPGDEAVREHTVVVAVAEEHGWTTSTVEVAADLTDLPDVPPGAAVVLDAAEDTWAASCADAATVAALRGVLPRTSDPMLRTAAWNNVRSGFHAAQLDPAAVVDLVVAAPYLADLGDTGTHVDAWTTGTLLPLAPAGSTRRVHDAVLGVLEAAEGDDRLRVVRGAVRTAEDPDLLRRWLSPDGLPAGVDLDTDLRWRLLGRLAEIGASDRDELDRTLAADPSTTATIAHTLAVASLPDMEAKAWAWQRLTAEADVPNHEVQAAGHGLWRPGQQALTAPYVERYVADLPATASVRSGWLLALAAEAFFPRTHLDDASAKLLHGLLEHPDVPPPVRRRVVDNLDDLDRQRAVARAFGVEVTA
ncbi:Aminopeptidase N [Nocardioides aquaticus]|uniref:Aminopeptidase N n=1 Tax=Nocardioides aquaticus TaxID=160826 RepID=A0ABX8ELJ3_9ACTN|nr:aminopeptidase N [Nocardioides aquaticus]QVT79943.1 Aminopeptidase N [Nocardioides aquaticus]